MRLRGSSILVLFLVAASASWAQATLPLSRITWSSTPTGWTDNSITTYTSALACDGNSNRGKFDNTGDYTQVFFTGVPILLSFDLQGNTIGATSSLLVEESANGTAWTTLANISNISGSCVTYTYTLTCATTAYVRWTYTKVTGNLAIDNVSISTGSCGNGSGCPSLTGAILNSCDNGTAGCNEGDAEIMFFNTGTYSVNVASLPSNVVNYYGGTASYTTPTIDAYTGTFSSNASTTSTLNSSSGCTGNFIDAVSVGTIPAGSTVMMVPNTFCSTFYDFSSLCSSFSPIYVLYFGTTGWSSSGNLANHQTPSPKPKYLTVDFSAACGGCSMQYYTYDADTESIGNGSGVAYSSISTSSATPVSPAVYTSATCTVPIVLPVDLVEFSAKRTYTNEAEINFTTLNEKNLKRFIISRSYDGLHYTQAQVQAAQNRFGSFHYVVYDPIENPGSPVIYYRLEEEDLNGVKKIIGNCLLPLSSNNEVIVTFTADDISINTPAGLLSAQLYNVAGGLLVSLKGNEKELQYKIDIRNYPEGFYLVHVTDVFGKMTVKKVIR